MSHFTSLYQDEIRICKDKLFSTAVTWMKQNAQTSLSISMYFNADMIPDAN